MKKKILERESSEGKNEYLGSYETEEEKDFLIEKDRKIRSVFNSKL